MDTEVVTESWVYAGQREANGQTRHLWMSGDEQLFFKKPLTRYLVIGGVYTVKVEHKEGGQITVHGGASYEGMIGDREKASSYRAADLAFTTKHEQDLLAKKAKNASTDLDEALEVLRKAYHTPILPSQRAGLLAAFIERITR